jgi:short-subunit dehydrogenase
MRGGIRAFWDENRLALLAAAGFGTALAAREVVRQVRQADLRGQTALITGGTRGLGLLLAREFVRQGCRVAICARDPQELERARQDLEARGAEVLAVRCDVSERFQVEKFVQEATDRFGGVDILVNNAGMIQVGPIQTLEPKDFEDALRVMFWGVLYPVLAVLPQMLERRTGRIANITSVGGKVSVPHLLPYNCAKFAAVGFSEGLRAELRGQGVTVTTIVPGLMRTGSFVNAYFKGQQEEEYRWFSLGASLPLLSMDAERAARQIVAAVRRGDSERILSVPAKLLATFHGLFPGLTADLLALADRLVLPTPQGTQLSERGMDIKERVQSSVLGALTRWGFTAAERLHQYPGPLNA